MWLEKYISFNTQKGNRAKIKFEKDIFKLPKNSFFRRMLENISYRLKMNLI